MSDEFPTNLNVMKLAFLAGGSNIGQRIHVESVDEGFCLIEMTNYNSTSAREGFKRHPGEFKDGEIQYFAHKLELR